MSEALTLTADEAIALLPEGEIVHNYTVGGMMIGADHGREGVIEDLRKAVRIQLDRGGRAHAMRHPLIVWDTPKHYSIYEADMDKVAALEVERA